MTDLNDVLGTPPATTPPPPKKASKKAADAAVKRPSKATTTAGKANGKAAAPAKATAAAKGKAAAKPATKAATKPAPRVKAGADVSMAQPDDKVVLNAVRKLKEPTLASEFAATLGVHRRVIRTQLQRLAKDKANNVKMAKTGFHWEVTNKG